MDFAAEFRADALLKRKIGQRLAKERASLRALVDPTTDPGHPLALGFEILRERSEKLAPLIAELHGVRRDGRLTRSIAELASSHVHMHVNRLMRTEQRAHELVLYDFLARLYAEAVRRI